MITDPTAPVALRRILTQEAIAYDADVELDDRVARIRSLGARTVVDGAEHLAIGLPVEFHCHGLGGLDFSDFASLSLLELDRRAEHEGVLCVPTFYLPRSALPEFVDFAVRFDALRAQGRLPFLPGFALEGPMLGSFGGTPERGVWGPTRHEWELLAACGRLGLEYVVLSPDAWLPGSHLIDTLGPNHPSLAWVIETLLVGGVRPALGHFTKHDPAASAGAITEVLAVAAAHGAGTGSDMVITDHLFNDMPVNVPYAWRTPEAQQRRQADLAALDLASWTLDDLPVIIGEVPAALIAAAHRGELAVCVNFDGEHLDTAIARRAVELMGPRSSIAMTDRTDVARLGGQELHREPGTSLWYQDRGVVAAGSTPIDRQRANMAAVGMDASTAWSITAATPSRVLRASVPIELALAAEDLAACVVAADGSRRVVTAQWTRDDETRDLCVAPVRA